MTKVVMPTLDPRTRLDFLLGFLRRQWREWRYFILFFGFVVVPVRSAVIDYSPVPTGSMNPTILEGDVVWINKLAYSLRIPLTTVHLSQWSEPARGDIVVVLSPEDGTRLVKRVVGVPGDTIALHQNRLVLNGTPLDYQPAAADYGATIAQNLRPHAAFAEEQLGPVSHAVMGLNLRAAGHREMEQVTVPKDRYFLMGDSRDNSHDSRVYGFARREDVLGKAEGVLVSLDLNDTYLPRWNRFFSALR